MSQLPFAVMTDETQQEYLRRVQRRTMIILVISQIVGTVGVGVAPSIGVLLAGEVTENEAWAGLARTASTLGAALLGVPLGILAARRGRRVALTTGWWLAGAGAGTLVFAAQWNLVVPLFIGLLLIGSGTATNLQARFVATDLAQPHHKAKSLALVVWVGTLGAVLGPNLGVPGAVVGEATGLTVYASAFLITSVCLSLGGLVIFVLLRPDPLLLLAEQGQADLPVPARPKSNRLKMIFSEIRSTIVLIPLIVSVIPTLAVQKSR